MNKISSDQIMPACPVFGTCGGCQYQHLSYDEQLRLKERQIREQIGGELALDEDVFSAMVSSPRQYHYRSRMDIKLLRIRSGEMFMGFSPVEGRRVVEIDSCPIAMQTISDFIPRLRYEAMERMPQKYRNANLTIKTGDDGRVVWGGIGRRSLRMTPEEYFWTDVAGKRIFFSLETFFQANLAILPRVIERIRSYGLFDQQTVFLDLYGGVGLFGICFHDDAGRVILIEENVHAVRCAEKNIRHNQCDRMAIYSGRTEDLFNEVLCDVPLSSAVVMIDPPRAGLSPQAAEDLSGRADIPHILYLSCHPESLLRDLKVFCRAGWQVENVTPFDFFPQTRHIETLVHLSR
ncbi:MAG: class I SAM-dependent RNA methyltransferase [Candidatus Omnitrophota bacterium]